MKGKLKAQWVGKVRAKVLITFFLLFLVVGASGQEQTSKIRFKHLTDVDGLSELAVNCIIQDRKGFMWFGTQDGLNRYDGYNFKIYKNDLNDKSSISDKRILCLYEDTNGVLWIGTRDGGLNRYNPESDDFSTFKDNTTVENILKHYDVQTICEDPNNILWVGTLGGGMLQLDKKKNEFKGYTTEDGLGDNNINIIFKDTNDRIWIGTRKGLDYFDQTNGKFLPYNIKISDTKTSTHNVTAICEESKGSIWIGTGCGKLCRLDEQGESPLCEYNVIKKSDPVGNNPIRCIFKDKEGILWVGTQKRLIRFNPRNEESTEYEIDPADYYSLNNNEVLSIYQDRTGIIWFSTYGGGLNIYDPALHRFKLYNKERNNLSHNTIWAIYEDRKERLWVGTYEGLNLLDKDKGKFDPIQDLEKEDIRCIYEDIRNEFLWIGTRENGLFKFNPRNNSIEKKYPFAEKVLSDKGVMCILQNHPDEMWIGTYAGGLDKFNLRTEEFTPYPFNNNRVRTILEDTDGNLWVGTDGGGLNVSAKTAGNRTFQNYLHDKNDPNSLSHNRVTKIYQDNSRNIWIGTEGGGLNLLVDLDGKNGHFQAFGLLTRVPNDTVYGILEDEQGNLWLSTNNGLFKVSLTIAQDGKIKINPIKNFIFQDGLQSNESNTGAYFKNVRTGEMFFGGARGLNSFLPQDIKDDPNKPAVILTDFLLFNISQKPQAIQSNEKTSPLEKAIDETGSLTLTYKQNVMTFEFAALSYVNPFKNLYRYKMEGYDRDWLETDAKIRRATYTNLPSGEYIFRVKGSNKDGVWSDKEASIKLRILPPPWKTWWAYCLYVIASIGIVVLFVRFRLREIAQELRTKEELERKVKERTAFLEKIDAIVRSINAEMQFADLLHKILKKTLVIKEVDTATAMTWNPTDNRFHVEAEVGWDNNKLKEINFTPEETEARYICGTEKIDEDIFIVRDTDKRPHSDKILPELLPKTMLIMCIRPEDKTQAYFIFGNKEHENAFAEQDIQLLQKLKTHIVEAFKKAQLIKQLQEINKELKETSDQLIQAAKLSSLGTLLAGIAHELFNPAGTIMLNAEWFAKAWKDIASILDRSDLYKKLIIANLPYKESRVEIEKLLSGLLESSRRIKNLLDELKNFARKGDDETKENIDIHTVIRSAVHLTQNLINKSTEKFSQELKENIPVFPGNSQRLTQVFINLIRNACEALPDNTHGISISSSYLKKTNEILIQVKDEGVGIEEQNLSKITDPFFTTRQNSGGMGLGLSISQKIIHDEHQGRMVFDSTPGKGTTVSVYLPVKPCNEKINEKNKN